MQEHEKPWHPLSVDEVDELLTEATFRWWIAGGIALELAIGREIRSHADIDILILRRDHLEARSKLADWDCWAADPPGSLRPWPVGQRLSDSVHDVWCRLFSEDKWRFQFMLDESNEDDWISRRDSRIRASIQSITQTSSTGIPYLAPHVQLYYKAKNPRDKDRIDFKAVIESGVKLDARWLRDAISLSYGTEHPWLELLPA